MLNIRQEAILEHLKRFKVIQIHDIIAQYHVSGETARRDLIDLAQLKLVQRFHGGASLNSTYNLVRDYHDRSLQNPYGKQQIARKAVNYIKEGQTIAMDVSTTNSAIANELVDHFTKLTVLTNSLAIAFFLAERTKFKIIMPGGCLKNSELCFVGDESEIVAETPIDVFFMSFTGVSLTRGFTDSGIGEVAMKKTMIRRSAAIYAVGDSTKFQVDAEIDVCELHLVAGIITDQKIAPKYQVEYEACGIEILDE